jgi:hypothetical protein
LQQESKWRILIPRIVKVLGIIFYSLSALCLCTAMLLAAMFLDSTYNLVGLIVEFVILALISFILVFLLKTENRWISLIASTLLFGVFVTICILVALFI